MKWSELDLINRIWTLPPARRTGDFVFTGYNRVALNQNVLRVLLRNMDIRVTPHGFRSSFRNWAAHAFPRDRDLAELSIGHKVKGQTEGAYWTDDMLEHRRPIMDAWAKFCGMP